VGRGRTVASRLGVVWLSAALVLAGCPKKEPRAAGEQPAAESGAKPERGGRGQTPEPVPVAGPVEPELSAPQRIERASALLTTGSVEDATRARDLLAGVVATTPDDVVARFDLGVALHRLGDLEGAAEAFSRVTRTDPDFVKGWLYLGMVEQQLGDVDAALRRFRTALVNHPDDLDLRLALVVALRAVGRHDEAITEATRALEINSRSLPVYAEMGRAWLTKGNLDMARFVFEKADTIPGAENNAAVQSGFGWVLHEQGDRYGAEYRLKRALEVDPRFVEAQVWLARFYAEDHNWPAAVPLLEAAVAADPRRAGLRIDLGNALRGLGRFDDAMAQWRKAIELDPSDPTPRFNLGVVLGDNLKRWEEAFPELEAYIAAGGAESALASTYLEAFKKEKTRAEQRKKSEEDRQRRQKEREEADAKRKAEDEARKKAEEAEKKKAEEAPPATPTEPAPTEPAPTSPWGPTPPGGP
jgi:tetratricopeptide (TPR) repeat protein